MAATKSTTFSETNVSIQNNTSSLTINITFSANNSSTWFENYPLNCTCNGITKTQNVSHPAGGSCSVSFTFDNIKHNDDGKKSVSWSWSCATGTSGLGTIGDSGTHELQQIARASTIDGASVSAIDSWFYISVLSKSTSFTHTIDLSFIPENPTSSNDRIVVRAANKTSLKLTQYNLKETNPTQYEQILKKTKHSNSVKYEILLYTYSGNTQIGDVYRQEMQVPVPQKQPILTSPVIEDTNTDVIDKLTGNKNIIVKYLSTPNVSFSASAYYWSDIEYYNISCGGQSVNVNDYEFLSGIDSNRITTTARDTRKNSKTETTTIGNFIDYVPLTLNVETCKRTEETSSVIECSLKGNYFNGSFGKTSNTLELKYRYRKQGDEWGNTYTSLIPTISNNTYSANELTSGCDYNNVWEFEFVVTDKTKSISVIAQITKGKGVIEIGDGWVNINDELYVKDYPVLTTEKPVSGQLIAYAFVTNGSSTEGNRIVDTNVNFWFSNDYYIKDKIHNIENYIDGILEWEASAIKVNTKGLVGMVECQAYISGQGTGNIRGFWWKGNAVDLPTGVNLYPQQNTGALISGPPNAGYGGCSATYLYGVSNNIDTSFYVDPKLAPYGGAFCPCAGGVKSYLLIKVYAK